jgi:FAD/FMN-containing dehydrogenase
MKALKKKLAEVVGGENVTDEPTALSSLMGGRAAEGSLVACFPATTEEVQEIVRFAGDEKCSIFTTTDTSFPETLNGKGGVLLGFRRMRAIEHIDAKNLAVHIERGVTYAQLAQALEPTGLKCLAPAAATSESVVDNAANRAVMIQAVRYPDLQASNFKVVLPDGQIQRTGSHALGEEMADWKEDGGPYLSKWYYGSGDIYGVITRGTIWIYPNQERRLVKAAGFADLAQAMDVMKALSRTELLNEAVVVNRLEAARLFPPLAGQNDPWLLIYGFESFSEHVDYLEKKADGPIREAGGQILEVASADLLSCVEGEPWYVTDDLCLGFYALFMRIPGILDALSEVLGPKGLDPGALPFRFVSFGSGRAVYCHTTLPADAKVALTENDYDRLLGAKAFFDRPLGEAAKAVYGRAEAYLHHLKRLKKTLDPGHVLNPGQPVNLTLP